MVWYMLCYAILCYATLVRTGWTGMAQCMAMRKAVYGVFGSPTKGRNPLNDDCT